MKKYLQASLMVLGLGIVGIGAAGAQSSIQGTSSYDLIVPGSFTPDSPAFSSTVVKNSSSANGFESNFSIGGGNTLNSAIYFGNNTATPTSSITSGGTLTHGFNSGEAIEGRSYRLGHSTTITTVVDVQSSGIWSPSN